VLQHEVKCVLARLLRRDQNLTGVLQALTGMLLERGLVAMVSKVGARGSYSSITLTPQARPTELPMHRCGPPLHGQMPCG
jgi:hypothetical protein